jgi:hypothetical protein
MDVIYNDGHGRAQRPCPVHDRRPIHPSTLMTRLRVAAEIDRRHADHYMPESGCPRCFR